MIRDRFKVARYTDVNVIEEQPGGYFFRRNAQRAADQLNKGLPKRNVLVEFVNPYSRWSVFSATVLARAKSQALELRWAAEDRARREERAVRFVKLLQEPRPSVLDDAEAGHPETVPARLLPWLDEDPTGAAAWGSTEADWDAANAGSLDGGRELPVRVPAGEIIDATAGITPEEAEKAWAGVAFVPNDAFDSHVVLTAENDPETAEMERRFQASPVAAEVDAFLADPTPVQRIPAPKRPVRKRPTQKEVAEAAATGGTIGFLDATLDNAF